MSIYVNIFIVSIVRFYAVLLLCRLLPYSDAAGARISELELSSVEIYRSEEVTFRLKFEVR